MNQNDNKRRRDKGDSAIKPTIGDFLINRVSPHGEFLRRNSSAIRKIWVSCGVIANNLSA
jgi:hypothetical protein